jgi:glycosyltransferase involved in cell wall biosynthesis
MSESRLKVLILAMKYLPASGGSTTYAYNLAKGLSESGIQVTLMAPHYGKRAVNAKKEPFTVRRMRGASVSLGGLRILVAAFHVWRIVLQHRPDVIWATSFAGGCVLALLKFLRIPLIGTIHGGAIHRRYPARSVGARFWDLLGMQFMHRADALVAVSAYSRKLMVQKIPDPSIDAKLQVIYNGISWKPETFVGRSEARRRLGIAETTRVILCVGRLIRAKGQDVLIRSIGLLQHAFNDVLVVIVGEGSQIHFLKQLAMECGVSPLVKIEGYVNDVALENWYGACDVLVHPGRHTPDFVEMFGLVLVEAGLRGKPVIASRLGGIPEAVVENKTGILVAPEDERQLANALVRLLENADQRACIAEAAKRHTESHFTSVAMAKNNLVLLQRLVTKKEGVHSRRSHFRQTGSVAKPDTFL